MIGVDEPTHERRQRRRRFVAGKQIQLAILDVPQSWGEAESEQVAKPKYMIGRAARVGVMLLDPQAAERVEKAVENVRRLAGGRGNDLGVVWKFDRLGRSLPHLIETVTALETRSIGLRSLTENIDTTTPGGRLISNVFGALAAFER